MLTSEGEKQAETLADLLHNAHIEHIVSSPFRRAVQSIEPLASRLHLTVETDPRLQERILSGSNLSNWRESLRQTFEQLDLCFPGGESSREAMQRAQAAVQDILQQRSASTIAIVSHGNLSTLLLKYFDETIGFPLWESMTTPDVFCIRISEANVNIRRVWQPDSALANGLQARSDGE